jgi:hypothetical protein
MGERIELGAERANVGGNVGDIEQRPGGILPRGPGFFVVELIVIEMTPLAEGEEVLVAVVAGDVVEVGDGEDDEDLAPVDRFHGGDIALVVAPGSAAARQQ